MFTGLEPEASTLLAGVDAINRKLKESVFGVKAEVYKRDRRVLRLEVSMLVQDVRSMAEGGKGLTTIFQVSQHDIPSMIFTSRQPMDMLEHAITQHIRSMSAHETEEWLHKAGLAADPHRGEPEIPLEPH